MDIFDEIKCSNIQFRNIVEEIDSLISEGLFGDGAKALVELRDKSINEVDFLIKVVTNWHENDHNMFKHKAYNYLLIFVDILIDAIYENPENAQDLIAEFWLGLGGRLTSIEFISSFTEFNRLYHDCIVLNKEANGENDIAKKFRYSKSISALYLHGVENIGKTLNLLICLEKIRNNKPYNINYIISKSLFEKINIFNKNNKYSILFEMIDRKLRNAEAHASLKYNTNNETYIIRCIEDGKRVERYIPITTVLRNIQILANYHTAFFMAYALSCLWMLDYDKFDELYNKLFN